MKWSPDGEVVAARRFVLDQRIRYAYSRPVANLRQRLRVVPPSAHGSQRRRRWHVKVDGVRSSSTRTFLDAFGNVTVEVHVPRVDDAVDFVIDVETETNAALSRNVTAVDRRYLRPTRLTAPDPTIAAMASETARGEVASLCARVHRSIGYEWGVTSVRTIAAEALAGGRGVCQDYAHIMLSACRAAGLAARYVSGHLSGEGGSHTWVEVLHPHPSGSGTWIAEGWDPTHNRATNANYLVVAVGRDYADAAPLSGTYEGPGTANNLVVRKRIVIR